MKTIILLLTIIFTISLFSCEPKKASYIKGNTTAHEGYLTNDIIKDVRYWKDTRTNLCFAEIGHVDSYSFTCVPCDSVKLYLNAE